MSNSYWTDRMAILALAAMMVLPAWASAEPPSDEGYEARRQWVLGQFEEKPIRNNTKRGIPDALARLKAADGRDKEALRYLANAIPGDAGMFDYPGIARALHQFGEHFSNQQIDQIKERLTTHATDLLGHGTENHAAMRVTSGYLFAQYFPDATWTYRGEAYTSRELMAEAKRLILQRGKGFYRVGNNEMLSSTYALINAYPFLTLQQYADDPEVRKAAEALVKYHLAMMALNTFDGHVMPPFNRRNAVQARFGPPEKPTGHYMPVQHPMSWLLWGQNEVKPEDFTKAAEPAFPIFFAVADWHPPEPLVRVANGAEAPYPIRGALGWFGYSGQGGHWGSADIYVTLRRVWRDRDFAIGGSPAQRFDPDGFYLDHHMFSIVWESSDRFRALEAHHPYWRSNNEKEEWKGTHSPFKQTALHKDTAIVLFNIPEKDPWPTRAGQRHWLDNRDQHFDNLLQLAQTRFPKSVDSLTRDGNCYFLRENDVYIAIRVLKPNHTLDQNSLEHFDVINTRNAKTGFIFEVGTAKEDGSFERFQKAVKANDFKVNWQKLKVTYENCDGDRLRFRYDTDMRADARGFIWMRPTLRVNGKLFETYTDNWPVAESPVVTLRNNILKVELGGDGFRVDWTQRVPEITVW